MQAHLNTLTKHEDGRTTIDLTINGRTETVRCWNKDLRDHGRGWYIDIYGIACKFRTGDKIWPAKITFWAESNNFSALEPTNYSRVNGRRRTYQLVGFESDYQESNRRSQHNGGYRD